MRAEDGVRLERLQMGFKFLARGAGNGARPFVHPLHKFRVVGLVEKHAPKFRRALDDFDVAVRVNFFVERREKFAEVHAVHGVGGAEGAPGLVQGGGGGIVARAGGARGNENAHGGRLPERSGVEKEKCGMIMA